MSPGSTPYILAIPVVILAVGFGLFARLPLPFGGFAAVAAAALTFFGTISLAMMMPARLLWSDTERLSHAFGRRHQISETRAKLALDAITRTHERAHVLRKSAERFADPLRARANATADRLDHVAREVFYDPDVLSSHRNVLVRSELIEDAVTAHAGLRSRRETDANADQIAQSRAKVGEALDALDEALDATETAVADRILAQVDVASATAEALLAPRK